MSNCCEHVMRHFVLFYSYKIRKTRACSAVQRPPRRRSHEQRWVGERDPSMYRDDAAAIAAIIGQQPEGLRVHPSSSWAPLDPPSLTLHARAHCAALCSPPERVDYGSPASLPGAPSTPRPFLLPIGQLAARVGFIHRACEEWEPGTGRRRRASARRRRAPWSSARRRPRRRANCVGECCLLAPKISSPGEDALLCPAF
jgi:hypothetical protein